MSLPDLPFDPSMPYALALPWPAPWDGVRVVLDQYRCESYVDAQAAYMADSRRALRALQARAVEIDALQAPAPPDGPPPSPNPQWVLARDEWDAAYTTWLRADRIRQLQYFVLRVEYPGGQDRAGGDPATWAQWPTRLIVWLADTGYGQARAALWAEPDPFVPASPPLATPFMGPTPPDASRSESPPTSAASST